METFYYSSSIILIIFSIIPLIQNQYWIFRVFDFLKVQILFLQIFLFIIGYIFVPFTIYFYITQICLIFCIVWELILLYKYTPFYKVKSFKTENKSSKKHTILSANVYQFNTEYTKFISLINKFQPDVFITMESNKKWDNALRNLEVEYKFSEKIPLENTYGIHLYSKLPFKYVKTHYFIADDIPSIEATIKTDEGYEFTVFAVHPPPPSPTEEKTSKERDGELLAIAKHIRNNNYKACIVIGDFNNVAWGKSSILFRKTSQMIDPRIGRGLISTYHAKYRLLRFPIDQMFHSKEIFVEVIKALEYFGSDHLPLFCEFTIDYKNDEQLLEVEDLEKGDMKEVNKIIEEGIKEDGERDAVVKE